LPAGPELRIRLATGEAALAGQTGEIEIQGPNVCSSYEDVCATAESFRDGWFRNGDLGYVDEDGFLFVTGRSKDQIKRGGETISPVEVERVLLRHPAVCEAVVFATPDERLGEAVAAAVVFAGHSNCDPDQLRVFAAESLSDSKVPVRIVSVPEIPRNPNGKVQRASLPELLGWVQPGAAERRGSAPPRDDIERELAEIWREVLRIEQLGIEDDFHVLGGGSLAVIRMLSLVQERYGVGNRLPERIEFFARPTIAHQAATIRAALSAAPNQSRKAAGVERLSDGHGLGALFCVPGAYADVSYFAAMARHAAPGRPVYGLWNQNGPERRDNASVESIACELVGRMLSVQPKGPYLVGGHCYGGILAYEMSQQLAASGQQVTALLLFDTPRPLYPDPRRHWRLYAQRVVQAVRQVCGLAPRDGIDVAVEGGRTLATHLSRLMISTIQRARVTHTRWSLPPGSESELAAARAYDPQPYPARVVHFIALCDGNRSVLDPRTGWREVAPALEEAMVPGDHTTMFHEPNVRELARSVESALA
jgi:thioesterase domain-containing protein